MDITLADSPPLAVAMKALEARRPVDYLTAFGKLNHWQLDVSLAQILREYDPERLAIVSLDGLYHETIQVIEGRAPLWEMSDETDDFIIYPDPHGYAIGWDDWEDLSSNSANAGEPWRLYLFYTALRLEGQPAFDTASKAFGWGVTYSEIRNLDMDRLKVALAEAGLPEFYNAMLVCWYDTGNLYFDWDPYDETSAEFDLPPLNLEGVSRLIHDWEVAQPIIEDDRKAVERFAEEPGLAVPLMDCLLKCSEPAEKQPPPGRSLGEVFGDDGDDDDGQAEQRLMVRL